MRTRTRRPTAVSVPTDLETPRAKLVYLYVAACEGATIDDLCESLELSKGTALTIANTLRDRGHLERNGDLLIPR